ncbi:MAG: MFS transporter [Chloroflexi bacterium]|nr:MFS transporter [Chloroflexota bacterium]
MPTPFGQAPAIRPNWAMVPLCAGVFVAAADQTVVVTILPDMLKDLRVPVGELDRASWTVTGYLIGYIAAMPLMGRLADRYGWHATFVLAMLVFAAGSALVALSPRIPGFLGVGGPDLWWAVGARVVQSIGGGAAIPIALAATAGSGSVARQATMIGIVGASAEAGGVVGPLWGGFIDHALSWEWAFWLNLPLVALLFLALQVSVKWRSIPAGAPARDRAMRVDYIGGALVGFTLTLITWALVDTAAPGTRTTLLVVSAFATGVAAWVWVRRSQNPIVPRGLFRTRPFAWATTTHVLVGAALITAMVTVPLMANTVLGMSALEGGLRLLRMTLAIAAGAVIGGALTARAGGRLPALTGLSLVAIGMFLMSRWSVDLVDPWMTVHLAVTGLGFGLLIAPVVTSALREVGTGARATASSWVTLARVLGMVVGLAAMTAWGTARFNGLVADAPAFGVDPASQDLIRERADEAGMIVFQGFFVAGAACAIAALMPVWAMTRGERRAGNGAGV